MVGGLKRSCRGQGTLEAALMMPLCLFMLFAAMQAGWTSFTTSDLDAGISHMQMSLSNIPEGESAASEWAKSMILENSTVLERDRLEVSGIEIDTSDRSSSASGTSGAARGDSPLDRTYASSTETATRMTVRCTVTYRSEVLFSVPGLTEIVRNVDYTKTNSQSFEVR